ncbi:hypothetical protein [Novosphingobium ginsenosidimutans]|uniref:MarR family transcriptional regulator n=1 Tax=Novosphingobium ginsenosidimutans TaxID=1176536 RepID=A0A5B8S2W3_9SPHN|nr:hypothetical protein [Novosphingobium ginsenosidimutans]QEA15866.1 hypothetical protein FRF71_06755 [Novosphingobium ginsenosidimutans]
MSSSKPALPTHLISDTDIPLDDWLNLVRIVRERRDRVFGADLFHDPAMSILVLLGREASKGGLPFEIIAGAARLSSEAARRWLLILVDRGFIEAMHADRFKLSADGRARLESVYS